MELRNYTPFPLLTFVGRNVSGREFGVVVLRGTFRLVPGLRGVPLIPLPEQEPVVEEDRYHGLTGESSLHVESDLAPFKPRSDIHVNAVAHAPRGRASKEWDVRMRVGRLEKRLHVTGPRAWRRDGGAWKLDVSEPALEVPLRYELAYGGGCRMGPSDVRVFDENPVGIGFRERFSVETSPIPAPQIESPDDPILSCDRNYLPEGVGPMARSWNPRRALAGTFDDEWRTKRWPDLPADFDFAHYNSAHPGLVYPGYLVGDEEVSLEGVHPDGPFGFSLPCYRLALLIRRAHGALEPAPLVLDTLLIDVQAERVFLTWRGVFGRGGAVRAVDIRMRRGSRE